MGDSAARLNSRAKYADRYVTSCDESGTLETGLVFSFVSPWPPFLGEGPWRSPGGECANAIVRVGCDPRGLQIMQENEFEFEYNCPTYSNHVTATRNTAYNVTVWEGSVELPVAVDSGSQHLFVSDELANALRESRLCGYSLDLVRPIENRSSVLNPLLWRLEMRGAAIEREKVLSIPASNKCPTCGFGPVLCPDCKVLHVTCRKCKRHLLALEDDDEGIRDGCFIEQTYFRIMELARWDGSDFIKGDDMGLATATAIEWLLEHNACPFIAKSCRACVDNVPAHLSTRFDDLRSARKRLVERHGLKLT